MTAKDDATRTAQDIQDLDKYDTDHILDEAREVLDARYVFNSGGQLIEIQTLITYGGPTVWVHYNDGNEWATVHYYDGSDFATAGAYAPNVCETMWEMLALEAGDLAGRN